MQQAHVPFGGPNVSSHGGGSSKLLERLLQRRAANPTQPQHGLAKQAGSTGARTSTEPLPKDEPAVRRKIATPQQGLRPASQPPSGSKRPLEKDPVSGAMQNLASKEMPPPKRKAGRPRKPATPDARVPEHFQQAMHELSHLSEDPPPENLKEFLPGCSCPPSQDATCPDVPNLEMVDDSATFHEEAEGAEQPSQATLQALDDLVVGDKVMCKGELAVVVKIDRNEIPPGFIVRMIADGREVGTERNDLVKFPWLAETEAMDEDSGTPSPAATLASIPGAPSMRLGDLYDAYVPGAAARSSQSWTVSSAPGHKSVLPDHSVRTEEAAEDKRSALKRTSETLTQALSSCVQPKLRKKAIAPNEGSGKKDLAAPTQGQKETLAPPEQTAGNASHAKDQAGFAKERGRFSMASKDCIKKLQETNEDLTQMETRINEIADLVGTSQVDALGELKPELAQLESKAKQLEGTGVDDIYTGDLHSGKDSAKDLKRNMLRRFEALYEKVDTIFAEIQKAVMRGEQRAAAEEALPAAEGVPIKHFESRLLRTELAHQADQASPAQEASPPSEAKAKAEMKAATNAPADSDDNNNDDDDSNDEPVPTAKAKAKVKVASKKRADDDDDVDSGDEPAPKAKAKASPKAPADDDDDYDDSSDEPASKAKAKAKVKIAPKKPVVDDDDDDKDSDDEPAPKAKAKAKVKAAPRKPVVDDDDDDDDSNFDFGFAPKAKANAKLKGEAVTLKQGQLMVGPGDTAAGAPAIVDREALDGDAPSDTELVEFDMEDAECSQELEPLTQRGPTPKCVQAKNQGSSWDQEASAEMHLDLDPVLDDAFPGMSCKPLEGLEFTYGSIKAHLPLDVNPNDNSDDVPCWQEPQSSQELCRDASDSDVESTCQSLCSLEERQIASLTQAQQALEHKDVENALMHDMRRAGISFSQALEDILSSSLCGKVSAASYTLQEELLQFQAAVHACQCGFKFGSCVLDSYQVTRAAGELWHSFHGVKKYAAHLSESLSAVGADVPLNGGAAWERMLSEVGACMRLAEPDLTNLDHWEAISEWNNRYTKHDPLHSTETGLMIDAVYAPLMRRIYYAAARVVWMVRTQHKIAHQWLQDCGEVSDSAPHFPATSASTCAFLESCSPACREDLAKALDDALSAAVAPLLECLEATLFAGCHNPGLLLKPITTKSIEDMSRPKLPAKQSARHRVKAEMQQRRREVCSATEDGPCLRATVQQAFGVLKDKLAGQTVALADEALKIHCFRSIDQAILATSTFAA